MLLLFYSFVFFSSSSVFCAVKMPSFPASVVYGASCLLLFLKIPCVDHLTVHFQGLFPLPTSLLHVYDVVGEERADRDSGLKAEAMRSDRR